MSANAPATSSGPSRPQGDQHPELDPVRLRMLTDACVNLASDHGRVVRRRDVRERVRVLMLGGHINVAADINDELLLKITYADPTGETACSGNVDKALPS